MSDEKKILILGIRNYANRRILHELKLKGVKARILHPQQLLPFVNDKRDDRIYIQRDDRDEPKRIYKKSLTSIVPRIGSDLQFYSKSVEHIQNNIGISSTASAQALLNAQDKIRTIQLLSQSGIKTPKTFAVKKAGNLEWIIEKLGGFPAVAKLIYGSQGIGVFILTEPLGASTALDAFSSQGHSLLLQQFIETAEKDQAKHDFRAVVVGGEVVAAIKRKSVGKDFRTNASIKEDCEKAELSDEMKDIAIRAAAAVGLDCAGVDLAKDINTGEIYCYEVNGNFNFKSTEKFSGKNVAKAIADYAVKIGTEGGGTQAAQESKYQFGSHEPGFEIEQLKTDDGLPFGDFPPDDEGDNFDDMEFGRETMRVGKNDQKGHILAFSELTLKGVIPSYMKSQVNLDARAMQLGGKKELPLWEAFKKQHNL